MVPAYNYFDHSKVSFDDWIKYVEERVWQPSCRYYLPSNKATCGTKEILNNMLYTYWNLKDEAIKYCQNDCISLYQIMFKFNEMFFKKFKLNVNEHPTLPGLAFRLFRSKYLKDTKIPMIAYAMEIIINDLN